MFSMTKENHCRKLYRSLSAVATLYMKGRPNGVSLELFQDFKFATEGEPYENLLCLH